MKNYIKNVFDTVKEAYPIINSIDGMLLMRLGLIDDGKYAYE